MSPHAIPRRRLAGLRRWAAALAFALGLVAVPVAANARENLTIEIQFKTMPNLIGKSSYHARQMLHARGIRNYRIKQIQDLATAPGTVLNHSPKPGRKIGAFKQVTLWISTGGSGPAPQPTPSIELVSVPDVVNRKVQDAMLQLNQAGLVARMGASNPSSNAKVSSQIPAAGTQVAKGSTVTLSWISVSSTKTVKLPSTLVLTPQRYGSGDAEFDGNGPHMTLEAKIEHTQHKVFLKIRMHAKEVGGDGSRGRLLKTYQIFGVAKGTRIRSVSGTTNGWVMLVNDVDTRHSVKKIGRAGWGTFLLYGDRKGKDLGAYTKIVARFTKSLAVHLE